MCVNDRESYFRLFVIRFIMNFLAKCTAFQSMAWSLIVHKSTIKNCSTALKAFSFRSLSFYLYFLQRQGDVCNSWAKRSASCICFPHFPSGFFFFFSLKHLFLHNFTCMTQGSCRFPFEAKYSHAIKNETFSFYSQIITQKFEILFLVW